MFRLKGLSKDRFRRRDKLERMAMLSKPKWRRYHQFLSQTMRLYCRRKLGYDAAGERVTLLPYLVRRTALLRGHAALLGSIAARAVIKRIKYGTSDVVRTGPSGCLRICGCAGDNDVDLTGGACADATAAKERRAEGQGATGPAKRSPAAGGTRAGAGSRATAHLLAVDEVLLEGPGSQRQAGVLHREGRPRGVRNAGGRGGSHRAGRRAEKNITCDIAARHVDPARHPRDCR